ncbi:uncharacterized protein LOC135683218 [Rhopilema esculentum]|uniref:uncharacterized protein LOC135683218 n=1 Tax=Rhopilema esculentum TaxID=499914 RepID=UPI0031DA5E16
MLKYFFESPEIAAIFATKDSNSEKVDTGKCVGCSRLRVGKQTRKRDPAAKKTIRKTRAYQQSNAIMFSARKARVEDAQKIASFNEENVYYDYDDETGTVIAKKHSTVMPLSVERNSFRNLKDPPDQSKHDVDIDAETSLREISEDFGEAKTIESYCPSDSAYDTNHDEYTDSLERLTIKTDAEKLQGSEHRKDRSAKSKTSKSESPYKRCRSSKVCGRNCELCRGLNNKILNGDHEQINEEMWDCERQEINKESRKQLKCKVNNVANSVSKHGLFTSKSRSENYLTEQNTKNNEKVNGIERDVNGSEVEGGFHESMRQKYIDLDKRLKDQEKQNQGSVSPNPRSTTKQDHPIDDYYGVDEAISPRAHVPFAERNVELSEHMVEVYDEGSWYNHLSYPTVNLEYTEQIGYYDAFSSGPHLLMLYDFKAEHEDDLSVCKGDVVLLLDNRDRDWVWVMTQMDEEGYVPRSLTSPFHDCEECRQEEIRQQQLALLSRNSSNHSTPRSSRTGSRSSATNLELNLVSPRSDQISPRLDQRNPSTDRRHQVSNATSPRSNSSNPWLDQISPVVELASMNLDQDRRSISDDQRSSNTSSPILQRINTAASRNSSNFNRKLRTSNRANVHSSSSSSISDEQALLFDGKVVTLNSMSQSRGQAPGSEISHDVLTENYTVGNAILGELHETNNKPHKSSRESCQVNTRLKNANHIFSETNTKDCETRAGLSPLSLGSPKLQHKFSQTFPKANKPNYRYDRTIQQVSETFSPDGISHEAGRAPNSARLNSGNTPSSFLSSNNYEFQGSLVTSKKNGKIPYCRDNSLSWVSDTEDTELGANKAWRTSFSESAELYDENIPDGSIRLIALSSFEAKEKGQLSVTAGDVIYVDIKIQNIPQWLWAYSPKSKSFGFIPENIVDQLKSSSV